MLREFAPAKLNLGLWILGRRSDGYHELFSLMIPVDLGDELTAEPAAELSVRYVPAQRFPRDLVREAAERLRGALGIEAGAKILVRKRIPVGAGLGGGSSDAAAALRLLQRLWGRTLPTRQLQQLALQLGSDVPFFLQPQPAFVRGRGERLQPLSLVLPYTFVVLYPGFPISTAWAYGQLQSPSELRPEPAMEWAEVLLRLPTEPELWRSCFVNEFEPVLFRQYPQLQLLRDELLRLGAFYAAVTGSGSAVFGVFACEAVAARALRRWRGSGVKAFLCRMYRGESA
jgi:4-diphosphocytidyl-2-C-methyl-D-erythritol kinase